MSKDGSEDGSYKSRHEQGLDIFRTIRGDSCSDVEQIANTLTSMMGPVASFCIDHAFGDVWSRPGLSRRDRSLVSVTALVCIGGAQGELKTHVGGALNHGATVDEIEELMLQICAYAGYPRGFDGMRIAITVFSEREDAEYPTPRPPVEKKDDEQRQHDGAKVMREVMGWTDDKNVAGIIEGKQGLLERYGLQHLMGEIWSRPQLSRRDRSFITLVALISLGKTAELSIHIPAALRHGMTREEIDEIILQLTLYVGYPTAAEAEKIIKEIVDNLDEAGSPG